MKKLLAIFAVFIATLGFSEYITGPGITTVAVSGGGTIILPGFVNLASAFFPGAGYNSLDPTPPYAYGTSSQYNYEYTQPFTTCAWVLPGEANSAAIFTGKFNINTSHTVWQGWDFGHNGSGTDAFGTSLFFQLANTGSVRAAITSPTNSLHVGQWSFACATTDGTGTVAGMHIYINAVLQGAGGVTVDALAGNSILTTVPFAVGGGSTNSSSEGYQTFVGNINQVTQWNAALSGGQISTLYHNGSPGDPRILGPVGNLVGYYPMVSAATGKSDTTSVIYDVVGGNNLTNQKVALNGITLPSPTYQHVSEGVFNGTNSYVDAGNNFGTNVLTSAVSYSFWATPTSLPTASNYYFLFGKMDPVGGLGYFAYVNNTAGSDTSSFNFGITSSGSSLRVDGPTGMFAAGVKKHYAITYDGSENANNIKLYVNGSPVSATVKTNTFSGSADVSNAFRIGARTDGTLPYNGNIDEFAIFGRALTANEVSQAYGGGTPPDLTSLNPTAWYRFENGGQYLGYAPDNPINVGDRAGFVTGTLNNVLYSNSPAAYASSQSGAYNGTTSVSDLGATAFNPDLSTHAHSWNIWIKPNAILSSDNGIFGRYDCANTVGYGLMADTRLLWYEAAAPAHRINVNSGAVLTNDGSTWYMVTVTEDGSGSANGVRLYLNGALQAPLIAEDALNGSTASTVHYTIGDLGNGCPYQFHGNIDMFSDYPDYVLTQYDIDNLYSTQRPTITIPDPRNLSLAAHLDAFLPIGEGSDTTSTFFDLVGSNNATNSNVTLSASHP